MHIIGHFYDRLLVKWLPGCLIIISIGILWTDDYILIVAILSPNRGFCSWVNNYLPQIRWFVFHLFSERLYLIGRYVDGIVIYLMLMFRVPDKLVVCNEVTKLMCTFLMEVSLYCVHLTLYRVSQKEWYITSEKY